MDSNGTTHGFLYDESVYSTIDFPGATSTTPNGISGALIVGDYTDSSGNQHGFLYDGSAFVTLDDPLGAGGTVPYGISGDTVVGYYNDASGTPHGFEASVPEPSGLAVLGLCVMGLVRRRRAKRG